LKYYSTNKQAPEVSFREATIKGLAPDRGLYFPEKVHPLDKSFLDELKNLSNTEIAFRVMEPFVADSIPASQLRTIIEETINFSIPLVQIEEGIYVLELFHGPTLAFKDIGARFMSRCLSHFILEEKKNVTVLVATSGDTGGAVADGFYEQEGIDVVILYPSGKVSPVQEQQLTTHGSNIKAIEIEGTFDDCQYMVKQAFMDNELVSRRFLTSANSINVARWLPQQIYYFLAIKQWEEKSTFPTFSVPSGNFGNIGAGMLAAYAGMPACKFIAACNANDVVPRYLQTEVYKPFPTIATISNAMDVGNPGNFIRIEELFRHYMPELKKNLVAYSIGDPETTKAISHVYNSSGYVMDPHSAVAYCSLRQYLDEYPTEKGIILGTAHAVKFPQIVKEAIGKEVEIPIQVQAILLKEKKSVKMKPTYSFLKEYLIS
jgi:threonine synthase